MIALSDTGWRNQTAILYSRRLKPYSIFMHCSVRFRVMAFGAAEGGGAEKEALDGLLLVFASPLDFAPVPNVCFLLDLVDFVDDEDFAEATEGL